MKDNVPLLVIGLIINSLITLFMFSSDHYRALGIPSLIAVAVSVIGFILMLTNKIKTGGILYIIGCILFVPIGLVGVIGVKKVMNEAKEKKFIEQTYESN